MSLPRIDSYVQHTKNGTPYLAEPGVVMIACPHVELSGVATFLSGFPEHLEFGEYLKDPVDLPPAERLIKFAGQTCYLSFDKKRRKNDQAEEYMRNIKDSGHGSVLEHASFSFLIYGVSRSFTHELVRHRTGVAFSQVSQRYVDGDKLRFVMRHEAKEDPILQQMFFDWIDKSKEEYDRRAAHLMAQQTAGAEVLQGEKARDLRKKVNQCARECLPNEAEAPIVFSANVRALRHVVEMRADKPADIAIRRVAYMMYACVKLVAPMLFNDYETVNLPDGVPAVTTKFRKV